MHFEPPTDTRMFGEMSRREGVLPQHLPLRQTRILSCQDMVNEARPLIKSHAIWGEICDGRWSTNLHSHPPPPPPPPRPPTNSPSFTNSLSPISELFSLSSISPSLSLSLSLSLFLSLLFSLSLTLSV